MVAIISAVLFVLLAPLAGVVINGLDRIVTARMQGRRGPPVLQPYYDVMKLFGKQNFSINIQQNYFVFCYLMLVILSGVLFFSGNDLLIVVFSLALADTFLILAAYSTHSPYAFIGAKRELVQALASEPILLLAAVGLYLVCGSFREGDILASQVFPLAHLPGVFFALLFILTIKFRKSPFDLATSHHAHQELAKGLTTEFAGPAFAMFELAHWYETVIFLGFVFLFFVTQPLLGLLAVVAAYFAEVFIDNTYARLKIGHSLALTWAVTVVFGVGNLLILYFSK